MMFTKGIRPICKLISNDLVEVIPISQPINSITYLDFKYERNLPLERNNKINKILERIKNNQNENKNY